MRTVTQLMACALSLVAGVVAGKAASAATTRPHMVVFVADDFGVADAGCYGCPWVNTPNIDQIAGEGTRFTRAFVGSPSCAPSRSILYTGLMSSRTGALPNHSQVYPDTRSIDHYLSALGYKVAVFNKVHVNPVSAFPFERVEAGRVQPEGGGKTIDLPAVDRWLEQQLRDHPTQPLCLFLCDNNTHLAWPDRQHPRAADIVIPPYLPDSGATRASLARYYTEVELLDERVGQSLAVLRKHKLLDSSLFLFTSDHGPAVLHGKWTLYDLGLQVPLIARWPGHVPAGATSDAMISFADITPTLVAAAGGTPVEGVDGRSALPSLLDPSRPHRSEVFATHTGDGKMNNYPTRCIRTERWKLIWNLRPDITYTSHLTKARGLDRMNLWEQWQAQRGESRQIARAMDAYQHRPEFELYDVQADPHEMHNLAADRESAPTVARLRARLSAWMEAQGDQRQDMSVFLKKKRKRGKP